MIYLAYNLLLNNTNNTTKYEVLLLGIVIAKERKISILNHRLKNYKNCVWDDIANFEAFSRIVIPRNQDIGANSLAMSSLLLLLHPYFKSQNYEVEVLF